MILILVGILTFSSSISAQDISGDWNWQYDNGKHISEISLIQNGTNSYEGYYCSVFKNGSKLDCTNNSTELCINIKMTSSNIFEGTF